MMSWARPDIATMRADVAAPMAGFDHEVVVRGRPGTSARITVEVVDFDGRREPTQIEMVRLLHEEGRLREVHLPGHGLKPAILLPGG